MWSAGQAFKGGLCMFSMQLSLFRITSAHLESTHSDAGARKFHSHYNGRVLQQTQCVADIFSVVVMWGVLQCVCTFFKLTTSWAISGQQDDCSENDQLIYFNQFDIFLNARTSFRLTVSWYFQSFPKNILCFNIQWGNKVKIRVKCLHLVALPKKKKVWSCQLMENTEAVF